MAITFRRSFRTPTATALPDGEQFGGCGWQGWFVLGQPDEHGGQLPNKDAAWIALKWLAGSTESQKYNFQTGWLPATEAAGRLCLSFRSWWMRPDFGPDFLRRTPLPLGDHATPLVVTDSD
jgi:hypothetical protein